ncbi:hypothetical protein DFQ26_005441 [Actinomortierella ambigua]|nr:hypothetical protein DFQ26_005441 [Actinomortierella ambigua]
MRICHYVILGVERTSSETDIKKAYRRKALEWHPDKNHHRTEEATKHFALIAEAYEVLMDPQERAWYDSHRDAILRGDERGGDQSETVAGTTAADLLKFYSGSAYKGFKDTSTGFFAVYRNLFQKLAEEEQEAVELAGNGDGGATYPSFGGSASPYESTTGEADVKQFYNAWLKFSTAKSFAWCDKYRLSEAPDRRVRRVMEKENKKLRDAARKEFNDTVLSLAAYIRKRDPRYATYVEEQKQKQEAIQAEVKARAGREKERLRALAAEFQEQAWARADEEEEEEDDEGDEDGEEIEEEFEHAYECILCDKYFKSERAWKNHEKSKKHLKAVEELREEMIDDENALASGNMWSLDDTEDALQVEDGVEDDHNNNRPAQILQQENEEEEQEEEAPSLPALKSKKNKNKKKKAMAAVGNDLFAEDDLEQLEQDGLADLLDSVRLSTRPKGVSAASILDDAEMNTPGSSAPMSRAESPEHAETPKAKLSGKAKKKARQELAAQKALTCNVCQQEHKTRNELFAHIKTTGHALAPGMEGFESDEEAASGKGGKNKKGRRK